ncbi:2-aminomuconic semialdehyde dehydrogenase-like isoform X2 [Antedon mediterranea]|uniref:2-aminomuconic semialdehyde dehydrogenase-like isoform X2 n=1 Tax=Antedon mediterranea TaxID=105859 RepID=UPI003AF69DE0
MAEIVIENYIGGEFIACDTHLDSFDPSTGKVWARIPDSGKDEVDLAVAAAKNAFPSWSSKTANERSTILNKIADIIEANLEELAQAESKDQGKPVSLARKVDIPRAVHNFRFFATAFVHTANRSTLLEQAGAVNYTTRSPIGVAGLISPWNLPLYLLTFKVAPCIAAGNTCVCKPSEFTSVTSWMFAKLLNEAGLPPGVVNFVYGTGPKAGDAIVRHPDIPIISFTGGTVTAQKIIEASAPYCKKLSLELGGKNPAIVFSDADLDKCINRVIRSAFANQGEICLCTSRIYVQDAIYNTFITRFVEATKKIIVGNPKDSATNMGALVSKEHLAKVKGYVRLAKEDGGKILIGDSVDELTLPKENEKGYFMLPTIITGLDDQSRCMQEEIFGPVVCIQSFTTEQEAIDRANGVKYGLCASVWTTDIGKTHRVAHKLQVGTVWSNCWLVRDLRMPFGGVKSSGIGREGADESLDFYTEQKTICIQHS